MICQNCKKNTATSHIHTVMNGIVKDAYLCADCAKEYKLIKFDDSDILDLFSTLLSDDINRNDGVKCSCCGADFEEIKHSGRVGCGNCYKVFKDKLSPSILKLHGSTLHHGKKPSRTEDEQLKNKTTVSQTENVDIVADLKAKLKMAIETEQYEQAAILRDEIKRLEE